MRFCELLQQRSGIVLGDSKQYLVTSRLSQLMREHQLTTLSELVDRLQRSQPMGLLQQVIDAMTTNETMWFRDAYPFDVLRKDIFPNHPGPGQLSIWCAACSSGQEPYSIAMTAEEYRAEPKSRLFPGVRIVATDISAQMLQAAKEGAYDSLAVARGLSPERKKKFFDELPGGRWQVKAALKTAISFQSMNLLSMPYSVGPFDVIFCRNVLIYFSPQVKQQVLAALTARLKKGGILFLGGSESLGELSERFEMIRCSPGIMYRLK
ncbi:protein-glutamate O-methyltransferase CheR [Permianibacter sp. IMCC34836]|uniref:CheR family methyltransferase n=1 Tax=Permianibacter fluminis TaxID=2738515 RepID=UPI0015581BEF|nr:protein-glutamate O-methyltransferase CheR [Permianibacter fluminis]NQD38073.1 protein-glutamate O-methyltransferase CheR [Permianibacter fluminis]